MKRWPGVEPYELEPVEDTPLAAAVEDAPPSAFLLIDDALGRDIARARRLADLLEELLALPDTPDYHDRLVEITSKMEER